MGILSDYRYQPLPVLSGLRHAPQGQRNSAHLSVDASIDGQFANIAFAYILLSYLDTLDFVFGHVTSTQDFDVSQLRPVRLRLEEDAPWKALADQLIFDERSEHLSWEELHKELEIASTKSTFPFPAIFLSDWVDDDVPPQYVPLLGAVTLVIGFSDSTLYASSDASLFSPETLSTFLDQVSFLLADITRDPSRPFRTPFESPLEHPSLFSVYNPPNYDQSVQSAFTPIRWLTELAKASPSRVAHEIYTSDSFEDSTSTSITAHSTLSYSQLNRRANRLATWLRESKGVKKGDRLAVCRERDTTFYVAHAAIWKLGAVYVSIDPTLPVERKQYIVRDSQAAYVITSREEVKSGAFTPGQGSRGGSGSSTPAGATTPDAIQTLILEEVYGSDLLENTSEDAEGDADEVDIEDAGLDDTAYLLYTSGTTGKPKGCLLTHRGVYHAIDAMCIFPRDVTDPENDKRLAMASIAFDVHISEIVGAWALGIRLVSAPGARLELLADMYSNVQKLGITHLGMVPSMIEATFRGGAEEGSNIGIKYLVSGGEKISDTLLEKWADHPTLILANFYGPTEATIGCTSRRITKNDRKENIGQPFPSCRAYVVRPKAGSQEGDPSALDPVLRGIPGELVVVGPLVGQGYHNNPEASRKAFIEWPTKGSRAYRTGDLVRMFPDGGIEIMGRIDSQIKLRGVRIEAEGVSQVIRDAAIATSSHDQFDVVTIIANHSQIAGGNEALVSFIAPGGDRSPSVSHRKSGKKPSIISPETALDISDLFTAQLIKSLKDAATNELASYMRPSFIIPVTFTPLNTNGKTDNRALKEVFMSADVHELLRIQQWKTSISSTPLSSSSRSPSVSPSNGSSSASTEPTTVAEDREPTSTESSVIAIVAKLLSGDPHHLSYATNLFEAGLDSVGFASLARKLRKELLESTQSPIHVAALMDAPTVEQIAQLIEARRDPPASSDGSTYSTHTRRDLTAFEQQWRPTAEEVFAANEIESVLPPLPVQEGVLFRTVDQPGHYVQHFLYRCSPDLDVQALKASWRTMVEREMILRTVFIFDETLLQVVLTPKAAGLPWSESALPESFSTEDFVAWFTREMSRSTAENITTDLTSPLYRVNLYSSPSGKESYMAVSLNHAIYDGVSMTLLIQDLLSSYHQSSTLPAPVDLRTVLEDIPAPEDIRPKEFWTSRLGDVNLRARKHRSPSESSKSERIYQVLNASYSDVAERCNSLHITFQAMAIAAFAIASHNILHADQSEALFGVIRSGRSLSVDNIERAICPLVCVVPASVNLRFGTVKKLLTDVQRDLAQSSAHEHTSLGRIQRWLGVSNLVESLFSCRIESPRQRDSLLEHIGTESPRAEFILAVEILADPSADTIEARVAYTSPELQKEEIEDLIKGFESALASLSSTSGQISPSLVRHLEGEDGPLESDADASDGDNVAPEDIDDELESHIAATVAKFLKVTPDAVNPQTSLVSLGLDSLRAVALSRSLKADGVFVAAVDIIQGDSVRRIATKVSGSTSGGVKRKDESDDEATLRAQIDEELNKEALKLSDDDEVEVVPATALQSGMISQTISSRGALYVHAFTFRLKPETRLERLQKAWERAISTFEILRTSFHFMNGAGIWLQAIHSYADPSWSTRQVADGAAFGNEFVGTLSFKDESDFARPPIYFQHCTTESSSLLVVAMHHALYDGVSLPKLLHRVRQFYDGDSPSQTIVHLRQIVPDIIKQERAGASYWAQRLAGFRPWRFPYQENGNSSAWRASVPVKLEASLLQRVCKRYHISTQTVGQAAWGLALCLRAGQSDVVFGQVVSGRAIDDAEDVIAPTFNTIPCRVSVARGQTYKGLLRAIQEWNVEGLPWHHASLRLIQRETGIQHLCDTLFLYQPNEERVPEKESIWEVEGRVDVEESKTQYAVNLEVHHDASQISLHASCASDAMNRDALVDLLTQVSELMTNIITQPNSLALPNDFSFTTHTRDSDSQAASRPSSPDQTDMTKWSEQQLQLRTIIAQFSQISEDSIGSQTDLASIGIDSISAIQIASRCKRAGLAISSADVASSRTIGDLAAILSTEPPNAGDDSPEELAPLDLDDGSVKGALENVPSELRKSIEHVLPVTAGMEWLIGGWQGSGGSRFQHAFLLQSTSHLDIQRLKDAWKALSTHHAILRSAFVSKDGVPVLVTFHDGFIPPLAEVTLDEEDEFEAVRTHVADLVAHPPSPSAPPLGMTVFRGRESNYVCVNLHHMQYDAWSIRLIFDDLERLYKGESPAAHNDYKSFLQHTNGSPSRQEQRQSYWKTLFPAQWTPSLFPSYNSTDSDSSSPRINCIFRDILHNTDRLEEEAKKLQVPFHTLLLTCWAKVQSHWTPASKGREAVFGLWHAGRSVEGDSLSMHNLAIPTINLLPIRVVFEDEEAEDRVSVAAAAKRLRVELQKRTPTIEQSRLVDVCEWAGGEERGAVCNVYVNVLRVPAPGGNGESAEDKKEERILKPVRLPYRIPPRVEVDEASLPPPFEVTDLVKDEVMVEIFFNPALNRAGLAIECAPQMLSELQAKEMADEWVKTVEMMLTRSNE